MLLQDIFTKKRDFANLESSNPSQNSHSNTFCFKVDLQQCNHSNTPTPKQEAWEHRAGPKKNGTKHGRGSGDENARRLKKRTGLAEKNPNKTRLKS